jgi:2-dehydro-3-deoxyphosphogluconate aldolase / (4S)-4-hydroxy-2-oxoglutarate aldolase
MERSEVVAALVRGRAIGVIRSASASEAITVGRALITAGMPAVEVALTTPDGLDAVRALAADAPEPCLVGAGTVLDADSARLAVVAGARFLVAPSLAPEMVRTAHRYGAAALPGAATPSEVVAALEAGADLVKLFPAAQLGVGYLQAVLAAIPQAPLVPTGGVDAGNARAWLDAGAVAVGVGGNLTAGGADGARARVEALLHAVSTHRAPETGKMWRF